MRREVFTCDICGKERGQVNHWFLAYGSGGYQVFYRWDEVPPKTTGVKHLCGAECAHSLLSRFLEAK